MHGTLGYAEEPLKDAAPKKVDYIYYKIRKKYISTGNNNDNGMENKRCKRDRMY